MKKMPRKQRVPQLLKQIKKHLEAKKKYPSLMSPFFFFFFFFLFFVFVLFYLCMSICFFEENSAAGFFIHVSMHFSFANSHVTRRI